MNREEKIWMHFFDNAGIEHSVSREYTRIFIENRMKPTNLRDLTKDLLTDMGIHAVGDILSILNAAKKVSLVDDGKLRNKTIQLNSSNVEAMKRQKVTLFSGKEKAKQKERIITNSTPKGKWIVTKTTKLPQTQVSRKRTGSVFDRIEMKNSSNNFPKRIVLEKNNNSSQYNLRQMVGEDGKRMSKAIRRTPKSKLVNTVKKSSVFDRLGDRKKNERTLSIFHRLKLQMFYCGIFESELYSLIVGLSILFIHTSREHFVLFVLKTERITYIEPCILYDFQVDCVELCTSIHERFRNFACALYELNDLGDKNGGVVIGKYDFQENQLVEIDRCTGPGVYQLIWVGDDRILTANSDGSLRLAAQTHTDVWHWFSSVPLSSCTILSVLSRNETNFVASDAGGYVHIASLDEADFQLEKSWLAHKHSGYFKSACEVWSLAKDPNSYHILYTGGEDGLLKLWDCRIQLLEAELMNSFHRAGVVCIRPNQQRSHILATSGYDDLLALWDIRNMQQCIDFIDLNSAAWTIRWDNENDQMRLLCACLSEGVAEISVENESTLKLTRKDQRFGANLVYGCDWLCAKDNTYCLRWPSM
ncbi:putative WD domain, G-beta repeat protein [Trichinella nativa]|uniref:methylated diphthine methylhydrolase n=1 Tax=Trichinella nativa TaxID=6335 RepID=A0A1Y3EI52_9BILA|nr:putative WD domain, G-beta repeat protein [Trichinella nativa]